MRVPGAAAAASGAALWLRATWASTAEMVLLSAPHSCSVRPASSSRNARSCGSTSGAFFSGSSCGDQQVQRQLKIAPQLLRALRQLRQERQFARLHLRHLLLWLLLYSSLGYELLCGSVSVDPGLQERPSRKVIKPGSIMIASLPQLPMPGQLWVWARQSPVSHICRRGLTE